MKNGHKNGDEFISKRFPPPQFPDNLSMNNNSHCKLHFWKLKVILRYFRRPLLVFQDQDAVPMGL